MCVLLRSSAVGCRDIRQMMLNDDDDDEICN